MKKLIIFGGSGFIGQHLVRELNKNYSILIPSRNPSKQNTKGIKNVEYIELNVNSCKNLIPHFEGATGIINLSGESVSGRWIPAKKRKIKSSRIKINRIIINLYSESSHRPDFLVQSSGIGVYGLSRMDLELDETSELGRRGFLTRIAKEQESSLIKLQDQSRLIFLRTGIVLDRKQGALHEMAKPFFRGVGGTVGSGKQWFSWIHIEDQIRAIKYLIDNKSCAGAYNLTAPNPVTQKEFAKTLGKVLNKPSFFKAPALLLKILLGEMANELLLRGLHISPTRLTEVGFKFSYSNLREALQAIYKK